MNPLLPSVDELNRLAKAIMQRHRLGYPEAIALLNGLRLRLIVPARFARRPQYQAALLTAINCGKRAFLGGVSVRLEDDAVCSLPGWNGDKLSKIVATLGGQLASTEDRADRTIAIGGLSAGYHADAMLVGDSWRGGILPPGSENPFADDDAIPLGLVFAAGLGVGRAFLDVTGIRAGALDEAFGLSLWRPGVNWLEAMAVGPMVKRLPEKLWLLGLGHLGQAYLWTLGFLPYPQEAKPLVFLHDFDRITTGNWCAGLLCEPGTVGRYKTRVCAAWAEARGFKTALIERPFDANTQVNPGEPKVALCGFDSVAGRRALEKARFNLIVESGLGSSLDHFDRIILHTFPDATKRPEEIWSDAVVPDATDFDRGLFAQDEQLGECGILLDDLVRKPISASFVGVTASGLVIGELLRGLHAGERLELLNLHLRSNLEPRVLEREEVYAQRHAVNGAIAIT
ncbi:MAG TPA: hypothetical protein VNW30_09170 [Opitutaceae bacterium]|jgi:hypothetical protein|nr:hypothetical protein [Opitutaceae bacterium]